MHALKTCLRAALATGALTSALSVAPFAADAAHADGGHSARTVADGAPQLDPLAKAAAALPKIGPGDVLKLAASQVGISENANGGGTKFQQWYMSTPRARETLSRDGGTLSGYANAPWCDMFVSWVGQKLGIQPVMGSDAYTVEHARWFAANHRWGTVPKPGAVVFFSWSGSKNFDDIDHVGFVVKDNGDGTIRTIEGNAGGGAVQIRNRPASSITGYGYPYYTSP
jgi:hypothetical protein